MSKLRRPRSRQYLSNYVFGRANKLLKAKIMLPSDFVKKVNEVEKEFIEADMEAEAKGEIPYQNAHPLFYAVILIDVLHYVHKAYNPKYNRGLELVKEDYTSQIPFAEKNLDKIREIHNVSRKNISKYVWFLPKETIPLEHILAKNGSRKLFDKGIKLFKQKMESDLSNLLKNPNYVLKKGSYLNKL